MIPGVATTGFAETAVLLLGWLYSSLGIGVGCAYAAHDLGLRFGQKGDTPGNEPDAKHLVSSNRDTGGQEMPGVSNISDMDDLERRWRSPGPGQSSVKVQPALDLDLVDIFRSEAKKAPTDTRTLEPGQYAVKASSADAFVLLGESLARVGARPYPTVFGDPFSNRPHVAYYPGTAPDADDLDKIFMSALELLRYCYDKRLGLVMAFALTDNVVEGGGFKPAQEHRALVRALRQEENRLLGTYLADGFQNG